MANFNHSSYRIERIYLNYSAPYNLKWMIFDVSSNGFGVHEAMLWLQDCAHYRLHMNDVTSQGSNTILSCISRRDLGLCVSSHLLLLLVGEDRKVCISVSWLLALGASTCGSTSGTSSTWQSSLKPITWHTNTLHVTHTSPDELQRTLRGGEHTHHVSANLMIRVVLKPLLDSGQRLVSVVFGHILTEAVSGEKESCQWDWFDWKLLIFALAVML